MEELTGLDARFLYSETPTGHMHTLKIVIVDVSGRSTELTSEIFVNLLRDRLDRLPALRRRVVTVPFRLWHPVWVEDPGFDLQQHLKWRRVPDPGGDRELAAVVADIAATTLPRNRPLWDLTIVEGLSAGCMAFVMKLHHSIADGGAAVAMLENAFMLDDQHSFVRHPAPEPLPERGTLARAAIRNSAREVAQIPHMVRRTLSGLAAARRTRRASDAELPSLFAGPRTSLNVSLDASRTFAMTSLPLEDLLVVKREAGATLNDVFLAICGGALRRYLARRGELPATSLIASVPIATHLDELRFSGNHVDNLVLPLGTDIADPHERVDRIHATAQSVRKVRTALGTELFEERAGLTPPMLYPLGVRLWARSRLAGHVRPPINLIASNVPGPREPLGDDGGVVTAIYSVGPILEGIGLNITAWSYVGRMYVSLLGCPTSLPDPWELVADLEESAREFL